MHNSSACAAEIRMHILTSLRGAKRRSNPAFHLRRYGLLHGACHRARIRATRWLAMTYGKRWRPGCLKIESRNWKLDHRLSGRDLVAALVLDHDVDQHPA